MGVVIRSIALIAFLGGCAHGEYQGRLQQPVENIVQNSNVEVNLALPRDELLDQFENIKLLIKKRELNERDISEIERLYALYQVALGVTSYQELRLPPHSRVRINFFSFCLDPSKSVPYENESFTWKKDDPKIPYYSKIMKLASSEEAYKQEEIQELIWNLKNKARYEDYPSS